MAMKMDDKRRQYERLFVHFDEDKDGNISPGELHRCILAIGGNLSMEEAAAAVEMIDSDGDGLLGMDDFVAFMEAGEGEVADREQRSNELRMAFEMYEEDEKEKARGGRQASASGRITPGSLKRMLSRLGEKRSVQECEFMISKFDLDGDGVLDFDEFSVMMS